MIKWLRQFFASFKSKPPSTVVITLEKQPKAPYGPREINTPPIQLESAIHEDNNVGHINFNKVRKITTRYKKKTDRHTKFYADDGDLIVD